MENNISGNFTGRFVLGLVFILLGALFLAHNLDFIYISHISRYWPAIFILIGVVKLFDSDKNTRRGTGLGWIFLGSWLLVSINELWGFDFHTSWPILIVGWGVAILWKALVPPPQLNTAEDCHGN